MDPIELSFTVNGREVRLSSEPRRPALEVLREELGLRSVKPGCSPQGVCGSCAALVDGKLRLTCTLPFKSLGNKEITTLEGWDPEERGALAASLASTAAARDGYSLPGLMVQGRKLGGAEPEAIARGLQMHSGRLGWTAIVQGLAGHQGPPLLREGVDLALGQEAFVADLQRPGMLHAALVFSRVPRARLKSLDLEAARALPGVVEVHAEAIREIEHVGEVLAVVVAASRSQARRARDLVEVELEEREPLLDPGRSRLCAASALDEVGDLLAQHEELALELAFSSVDPGFIEPEAALAVPTRGGLRLYSNGECARLESLILSEQLGCPVEVEILGQPERMGGRGLSVQRYALEAARRLDRPVKLALDLEEGMLVHPRRHACSVQSWLTLREGRLSRLRAEVLADGGARPDAEGFAARFLVHAAGAYALPARSVSVRAFETHNPLAGDLVGEGTLQALVSLELAVDRAARAQDLDPLELRLANLAEDAASVRTVLEALAAASPRPSGLACALERRSDPAPVALELDEGLLRIERASLGQGFAAELRALGGDLDIEVSSQAPPCPGSDPDLALRALERALAGEAGSASGRPGEPLAAASCSIELDETGAIQRVVVAAEGPEDPLAVARAEVAVAAGLGLALSEAVGREGGFLDTRLRNLGLLKARDLPPIELLLIPTTDWREPSTAVTAAVASAVLCAVERFEAAPRRSLPAADSEAAFSVGVRRPRKRTRKA
jgi:CO/xanthine dehydrogenase Mo-binding subunit/aerobic-type carbon monoxide dehydrogenase small subunit (CoxS/CutS family)